MDISDSNLQKIGCVIRILVQSPGCREIAHQKFTNFSARILQHTSIIQPDTRGNIMILQYQSHALRPLTTAHLAQTMTLLELSGDELRQKIEAELSSNPALELHDEHRCSVCGRKVARPGPCPLCSKKFIYRSRGTDHFRLTVFRYSYLRLQRTTRRSLYRQLECGSRRFIAVCIAANRTGT